MDFKLKKSFQIHNKESGAYESESKIVVSFVGKKGLKSLKGMQDVIFKTFQDTAGKGSEKKQNEHDNKDITADDMLMMLDMTGNSERVFDCVMDSLKDFGKIGNEKLNDQFLNEMDIEDLDGLSREVLKSFLLPRIILQMNSMNT